MQSSGENDINIQRLRVKSSELDKYTGRIMLPSVEEVHAIKNPASKAPVAAPELPMGKSSAPATRSRVQTQPAAQPQYETQKMQPRQEQQPVEPVYQPPLNANQASRSTSWPTNLLALALIGVLGWIAWELYQARTQTALSAAPDTDKMESIQKSLLENDLKISQLNQDLTSMKATVSQLEDNYGNLDELEIELVEPVVDTIQNSPVD